jgi:hypothetical protein
MPAVSLRAGSVALPIVLVHQMYITHAIRATGATIQILLFAVLAIEVKRKAPTAHTVLEIVLVRWGRTAHTIFLVFCLLTNCIVTAMLILGGAAVVAALTGVPPLPTPLSGHAHSLLDTTPPGAGPTRTRAAQRACRAWASWP